MLTQHKCKTARLSPDYTFAIRELGVWSGDETTCRAVSRNFCILRQRETDTVTDISIV